MIFNILYENKKGMRNMVAFGGDSYEKMTLKRQLFSFFYISVMSISF